MSGHRAVVWLTAIACFRWHVPFSEGGFIVPTDFLLYVGHTAVTDLNCGAVKDLVQRVVVWEFLVEDLGKTV